MFFYVDVILAGLDNTEEIPCQVVLDMSYDVYLVLIAQQATWSKAMPIYDCL